MEQYTITKSMSLAAILEYKGFICLRIEFDDDGINTFYFEGGSETAKIAETYKTMPEYRLVNAFIALRKRTGATKSCFEKIKNSKI
ncbi:MAG TPA: DUF5659 domain-containing protein [Candidatus Gracilibacteria bacterium]|nr:DUF5659 domain-containing protein [Candidatus Gracilibacteria bacterium]